MPERRDVGGFLLAHSAVDLQGGGGVETNNTSIVNYQGGSFNFGGFEYAPPGEYTDFPTGPRPGDLFYDFVEEVLYYYTGDPSVGIDGWDVLQLGQGERPRIHLRRTSNQTATAGGDTVVNFNQVIYNVGFGLCPCDMDSTTIPEAGVYNITFQITWNSNPSVDVSAAPARNGAKLTDALQPALGHAIIQCQGSWTGELSAGDVITLVAFNGFCCACDETFGTNGGEQPTYMSISQVVSYA